MEDFLFDRVFPVLITVAFLFALILVAFVILASLGVLDWPSQNQCFELVQR